MVEYLAGNRVRGLNNERASLNIVDGSIFYETDTNKSYVLYSDTWSEI